MRPLGYIRYWRYWLTELRERLRAWDMAIYSSTPMWKPWRDY